MIFTFYDTYVKKILELQQKNPNGMERKVLDLS